MELVSACGPYELSVSKTMIAFKGRRRGFAGARPTKRGVSGFLDLQHPVTDPRFTNVAPYTKHLFVHHFLLTDTTQLDRTCAGWVREAYEVGAGGHLAEGSGS